MDHLTIPEGAAHIKVPYRCTEIYDGGNFFEYPSRKGWSEEHLLGKDNFGGRTDAEVEGFFQSWLYFGTLFCVFKLQGIDIDMSEFLITDEESGKVFVSSFRNLTEKIQAWRMGRKNDRDSEEAKMTYKILNELSTYTRLYCGIRGQEYQGAVRISNARPVAGEISMSMIALGYILEEARRGIFEDGRTIVRWEPSLLLKERLLNNGLCPLDVRRILADMEIDGHYYLALRESPYNEGQHGGCDEFSCRASTVIEATYLTKHMEQECTCEHATATEEVVKVIRKGGIPVVSWRKDAEGYGSRLIVEDAKESAVDYIAVSHVWADGLGNPHENSLPICQLDRIQAAIDAVFPEAENLPARFWMDTLCIPVADEHKSLRKASIKMMRQIYRHAEAVLIFDSGLQRVSLSATINEKVISVYMSNWLHRLWTFQEGMLAKAIYFQFKEGSFREGDLDKAGTKEQKDDEEKGLYGSFQSSARGAATGHFIILRDFVDMKLAEDAAFFPQLCHAVQQRSTTRISDEAICAATILEINMDDIHAVETRNVPDEVVADTRMEIFLKQIGEFAPAIIFHHQKCLQREGYRWAPKTLMGAAPNDFVRGITEKLSSFKGKGLRVRFPGLVFQKVPQGSEKEITVVMKHNEHRFRLRIFPEDADSLPLWDPTAVYAVIMFEAISARYPTGTDAIVGILKDHVTLQRGARLDIRREYRAWLEPIGLAVLGGAGSQGYVVAEMLSGNQRWRVL